MTVIDTLLSRIKNPNLSNQLQQIKQIKNTVTSSSQGSSANMGRYENQLIFTNQPQAAPTNIPEVKPMPAASSKNVISSTLKPSTSYKATPIAGEQSQPAAINAKLYSPLTELTSGGTMLPSTQDRLQDEASNIFFGYQLPIFEKAALATAAVGTLLYGATALPLAGSSLSSTAAATTAAGGAKAAGTVGAGTAGVTTIGKIITKTKGGGGLLSGLGLGFLGASLLGGGGQDQTQDANQQAQQTTDQTQDAGITAPFIPTQDSYQISYNNPNTTTFTQQDTYSNIYQYGSGSINSSQAPETSATPVINIIPTQTPQQTQGLTIDQLQGALSELGQQLSQGQEATQDNSGLLLIAAAAMAFLLLGDRK